MLPVPFFHPISVSPHGGKPLGGGLAGTIANGLRWTEHLWRACAMTGPLCLSVHLKSIIDLFETNTCWKASAVFLLSLINLGESQRQFSNDAKVASTHNNKPLKNGKKNDKFLPLQRVSPHKAIRLKVTGWKTLGAGSWYLAWQMTANMLVYGISGQRYHLQAKLLPVS